jgi:hypothetical protein
VIPYYNEHPRLCVARCVHAYMDRTRAIRRDMLLWRIPQQKMNRKEPVFKDRLILGLDRSAFPIGAQRIAGISKECLKDSGIDITVYKPHSLRGASASAQLDIGEDVQDVMWRGRWRSYSVFKRFYERVMRRTQLPSSLMSRLVESIF